MPLHSLSSGGDVQHALSQSEDEPVVLYKHSSTCPLSARANDEMERLAADDGGPPVYRVVVQESRDVSDDLAERFSIRHETPQAIVVDGGEPTFDTSHGDVTAEHLREAAAAASS